MEALDNFFWKSDPRYQVEVMEDNALDNALDFYTWAQGRNDCGISVFMDSDNEPIVDLMYNDGEEDLIMATMYFEGESVVPNELPINCYFDDAKKWYMSFVGALRLFMLANDMLSGDLVKFIAERTGCAVEIGGAVYTYDIESNLWKCPHCGLMMVMDFQKLASLLSTLK